MFGSWKTHLSGFEANVTSTHSGVGVRAPGHVKVCERRKKMQLQMSTANQPDLTFWFPLGCLVMPQKVKLLFPGPLGK